MTRSGSGATEADAASTDRSPGNPIGRRALLVGAGVATATGVAGWFVGSRQHAVVPGDAQRRGDDGDALPATHAVQGVTDPLIPQRHTRLAVFSLAANPSVVRDRARRIIDAAARFESAESDAGQLGVTLGFTPPLAAQIWPDRVPNREVLPPFSNDGADIVTSGEMVMQVSADTAFAAAALEAHALAELSGLDVTSVWQAQGYRDAPTKDGTSRTGIGFIDGIMNPRDAELLEAGVWIGDSRDTYLVVRRMHISDTFTSMPVEQQETAVGRRRSDGAPLSGGDTMDPADLFSKTPDGKLLTPIASHVRRAHPSNIGRPLMLRRSYTLGGVPGAGLLFMAYMNDPATFVMTQRRLDEQDDLIAHTSTDASGVFFVPDPETL